jgi:hypothetical protein
VIAGSILGSLLGYLAVAGASALLR